MDESKNIIQKKKENDMKNLHINEKKLAATLTNNCSLSDTQLNIIKTMETRETITDLISKYSIDEFEILKRMLRWKIMKNLCIETPKINFSNEVIDQAVELSCAAPNNVLEQMKLWIDEQITTKELFQQKDFFIWVCHDTALKNFWYILSEVTND